MVERYTDIDKDKWCYQPSYLVISFRYPPITLHKNKE